MSHFEHEGGAPASYMSESVKLASLTALWNIPSIWSKALPALGRLIAAFISSFVMIKGQTGVCGSINPCILLKSASAVEERPLA